MGTGPSQKFCAWGEGEGGGAWLLHIFPLVLAKPELLVPRVSGVFPFKDIVAAEISLFSPQPPGLLHFLICKKGLMVGPTSQGWGVWHGVRAQYWGSDEDGDVEEGEWI